MREQLEMTWNGRQPCKRMWKSRRRRLRTHWWFEQMRRTVDEATDWKQTAPFEPHGEDPHTFQNN
jgi:hypothetical protein